MTIPVIVVLVMLAAKFVAATYLDILNMRSVREHSGEIPKSFKDFMDFDTYRKGIAYTLDKTKFGIFESFCGLIFLSLVLALWILPKLFDFGMDTFGVSVFGHP